MACGSSALSLSLQKIQQEQSLLLLHTQIESKKQNERKTVSSAACAHTELREIAAAEWWPVRNKHISANGDSLPFPPQRPAPQFLSEGHKPVAEARRPGRAKDRAPIDNYCLILQYKLAFEDPNDAS